MAEDSNRIYALEDTDGGYYSSPGTRLRRSRLWWYIPIGLLFAIAAGATMYYFLYQKKKQIEHSRLSGLPDLEDANSRKMSPGDLPDDQDLRTAVDLYNKGYLKPANSAFQQILETSRPDKVKAYALIYMGIMADDEGKFNLATDFFERSLKFDPGNFYAYYNLAIALRHKGLYKEALQALEKAQSIRPDLVEPRSLKGQLQYQNSDLPGAETTLKAATESSKDPLAYYNLAMVYKKSGKFAEAKSAFLEALNLAVAGEIAYKAASQLGLLHATQGDLPNAKYYLERAIELAPQNGKYRYNLALVLYRSGDTEGALKHLQEAIRMGQENPQTYMYIARLYTELGKKELAEEALKRALGQAPQDTVILSQLADLMIEQGKWGPATVVLKRIYELSSKSGDKAQALYNLGRVYTETKDWESARKSLENAYSLDPLNEDALVALGEVYARSGQGHKAISMYKESLKLNPDNLKVLRAQADLYLRLGLLTEAEEALRKLSQHPLKKDTDAYFAYQSLGDLYSRKKAYDTAIEYYEKAENTTDSKIKYHSLISSADAILKADRPSQLAFSKLEKAIALDPESEEARILLARALIREGSVNSQDRADEELTAIIQSGKSPELISKAHTMRGILYYKQSLYGKAIDEFNRSLELDPSNQEAFQNRKAAAAKLEGQ